MHKNKGFCFASVVKSFLQIVYFKEYLKEIIAMANITFVGDIMCSPRMTEILHNDYTPIFSLSKKLSDCDYLVGNLETPIAGEELKYTHERYCFNSPTNFLAAVRSAGFELLALANNHCMDRGEEGIVKTLENCRSFNFDTVGIYATKDERDEIFVKEIDGIKVSFINYTYGTNAFSHHTFLDHKYMVNLFQPEETLKGSIHLLNSYSQIADEVNEIYINKNEGYVEANECLMQLKCDIEKAKKISDYVIVLMHSGSQYITEIDPYSAFLAEKIKEFGADMIVGHHQHIIQSCDTKEGYLKVFSLGNFLCDTRIQCEGFYSDDPAFNAVLHVSLNRDENGKICAKASFSIYMTVYNELGIPMVVDSCDVYRERRETSLWSRIIGFANLFIGENRYNEVMERYELI